MSRKQEPAYINPYSVHTVISSHGHSVVITYAVPGEDVRKVDLSPVLDLSYGDAVKLRDLLGVLLDAQPRIMVPSAVLLRARLKTDEGLLASAEKDVIRLRRLMEQTKAQLKHATETSKKRVTRGRR